jgi:cystathionine gamma-synthase
MGGVLGPFEAWLLLRGLRTLFVRFERASANALQIARHFEGHGKLEAVLYPGLESHPGHAIAKRQMTAGYSGMLSLLVKGDAEDAKGVATRTALFVPATSLGGVESLIEHRATIEGPRSQVPPNLLRLSIGIEDARDLIADLEQALAAV